MIARTAASLFLALIFCQLVYSQVEENHVDFTVSPSIIQAGNIQVAYEWLKAHEFKNKDLSLTDLQKVSAINGGNNQLVAAKLAFISHQSFDELSYAKMNTSTYISNMLNSVSIKKKSADSWRVTNRVKAYGLPFRVSFDFKFREVSSSSLTPQIVRYFRDEAAGINSSGRERFLVLDMTNFSQLIYRNYSVVYIKEIGPDQTLLISTVMTAIDIKTANSYFNYPPISSTERTMMNNLKTQIMHMARKIQK